MLRSYRDPRNCLQMGSYRKSSHSFVFRACQSFQQWQCTHHSLMIKNGNTSLANPAVLRAQRSLNVARVTQRALDAFTLSTSAHTLSAFVFLFVVTVSANKSFCDLIVRYRILLIVVTSTSRPGGHSAIEEVPRRGIPHQVRHHHIASVWHSWQHNKQIQERDNHSIEHCEVVRRPAFCITPPRKCSNIRRCIAQLTLFERNTQPYLHPRPRASHRLRFARRIAQLADVRSARPRATASDVFVHHTCSHRRQVAAPLPLLHSSCQLRRSNESDATEHWHLPIHAITSVPIN